MARVRFTLGKIRDFGCETGRSQAFLWDTEAPGLGLRATPNGAKSFIFQAKLNNETLRMTLGSVKAWTIDQAQAESRRLKVLVDSGRDPRQLKVEERVTQEAAKDAAETAALRESVTLGDIWPEYVADRISKSVQRLVRTSHCSSSQAHPGRRGGTDSQPEINGTWTPVFAFKYSVGWVDSRTH